MGEYSDLLVEGIGEPKGEAPPPTNYTDMLTEEGVLGQIPDIQEPDSPIMREVLADQRAGFMGGVRNFKRLLTGEMKEEDLPSFLDFKGTEEHPLTAGKGFRLGMAYLLAVDDAPVVDIIKREFPAAEVSQDEFGNSIVELDGKRYYVNQPGIDKSDVVRFIGQVAQFGPAAKATTAATGALKRAGIAAAGSAGTSVAQDTALTALGSEQGIDPYKAGGAAVGGAAFELLAPLVGRVFNRMSGRRFALTDGSLTPDGRKFAQDLGIDPDLITPELAKKLNNIGNRVETRFAGDAAKAAAAKPSARTALADEFGIPLTKGEAAGNVRQMAKEEAMRNAARGGGAQKVMQNFDQRRAQAIEGALAREQGRVSGTARAADDVVAAAEATGEAVRRAEKQAERSVAQAYATAKELNAKISGESMKGFRTYVVGRMREGGGALDTIYGTTPKTQAALRLFRNVTSIKDGKLRGTDLKRMEKFRRYLNSQLDGAKGLDRKNLTLMKKGLDEWLDAAVDRSLFQGDEAALAALKEARAKRFDYGQLFEGGDDAARVIRKIVDDDASSNEIANWLFGNASLGQQGRSVRLVKRMEKIFGKESPEFNLVREGAFMRMVYGNKAVSGDVSAQNISREALANNIRKALDPRSREFMQFLFTPDEIKQFTRLEQALRSSVVPREATNRSGSGYEVARAMQDMFQKFVTMGSLMFGGPGTGIAVAGAQAAGKKLTSAGASRSAVKRLPLPAYRAPTFTAVGGALGAQEASQ